MIAIGNTTDFQDSVLTLIKSFGIKYSAITDDCRIVIFIYRKSPEYRKCRNAIKKQFGLTKLWDNDNLMVGSKDKHTQLVINNCP